MSSYSLAIDIGGTFTDFVLKDGARQLVFTEKVLTTPGTPDEAIFQGLDILFRKSGLDLKKTDLFLHATTITTNAVIERKGRDFILLHTAGFRDVLEIGREHRYNLTNLKLRFPDPLSKRALRLAVEERVSATGKVVNAPNEKLVMQGIRALVDAHHVTNFAICFLHSYRNPANELLVRGWIEKALPNAYISTSSSVAPTQREYDRWTTCVVNAYTMPLLAEYVRRLQAKLGAMGFSGRALMMTSSGLPMDFDECVKYPVRLIESGAAAGVLSAREIAARNADMEPCLSDVLAYDMGGTTAKGAFLTGNKFHVQRSMEVARIGAFEAGSGFPLMVPAIDLIEIGAGGGSIAEVDGRGVIAVGPRSAGADPGPACYARGGRAATLTDANMVLGLLDERNFGNSGITVRAELAVQAIDQSIASRLGVSTQRAALGIHETVNENVARAFRVHAAELGIDYRRYTLICTGGSSPLHAAHIARILNISRVVFPFGAGVSSAFGLFAGNEGITLQHTRVARLDEVTPGIIAAQIGELLETQRYAGQLMARGAQAHLTLDMRYAGQGYEVSVKLGSEAAAFDRKLIKAAFEREYAKIFGLTFPDYSIEIFNWTLEVNTGRKLSVMNGHKYQSIHSSAQKGKGRRRVVLDRDSEALELEVYNRYALTAGDVIPGAALIEENDTTIYLPEFARGVVQSSLDIVAAIRGQ